MWFTIAVSTAGALCGGYVANRLLGWHDAGKMSALAAGIWTLAVTVVGCGVGAATSLLLFHRL